MAEIINFEAENLEKIVNYFNSGRVLAFPTDTVYGMGVSVNNREAIKRFYDLKQRASDKPSQILIADNQMLYQYVQEVNMQAEMVMERFWPGALTLIFHASSIVPNRIQKSGSVGVRMPNYPLLQKVITLLGCPLIDGSANFEGNPTPTDFENLDPELVKSLDAIISGPVLLNKESTIVDARNSEIKLVREGVIKFSEIQEAINLM